MKPVRLQLSDHEDPVVRREGDANPTVAGEISSEFVTGLPLMRRALTKMRKLRTGLPSRSTTRPRTIPPECISTSFSAPPS